MPERDPAPANPGAPPSPPASNTPGTITTDVTPYSLTAGTPAKTGERTVRCLSLIAVMLSAGAAVGLGTDDVLFYAPFDGSADAALARGDPKASSEAPFAFMPGILGQAILVGTAPGATEEAKSLGVGYRTSGNVLREQGSVSVWVQALDWEVGDGKNHRFVTVPGQGVTF